MAQSEQEILEGLAEIVNEETGLDTASVEMDKSFTEDSTSTPSMMTIVVNAEEKFGVRIPDNEVKNLKTVRDAVSYIGSARAERPSQQARMAGSGRGPGPSPAAYGTQQRTNHPTSPDEEHLTMTSNRRVVVTGLGATTPVGGTAPETGSHSRRAPEPARWTSTGWPSTSCP